MVSTLPHSFRLVSYLFSLAQGNQGPEGVHQDRSQRAEEPAHRSEDHYQEEQEKRHHKVQAENLQILAHPQG